MPGILEGSESGLRGEQDAGTEKNECDSADVAADFLIPLLSTEALGTEDNGCI